MSTDPQYDAFEQPYAGTPPHQRTDTSVAAAHAALPFAATLRRKVLDYITDQGARGAIDEEIEEALGLIGSTVRPRRRELVLLDLVVDSGERRTTSHGRKAAVWRARSRL